MTIGLRETQTSRIKMKIKIRKTIKSKMRSKIRTEQTCLSFSYS